MLQRAKASADTGDRILDAAEHLFAERGFDGVSARDIAEAAGVNKALVFYHHGSKAELFDRVLDRYYEAHARALTEGATGGGPLAERLHRLVDTYLDFMEEHSRYARLVQMELATGSERLPRIRRGVQQLHDTLAHLLEGVTRHEGPLSSRHFFVTFSGLVNTYFLMAPALEPVLGTDPMRVAAKRERREHVHWILDAILEGLQKEAR
ncbi:MAG: TetR/AcrR family transcriptional regulator [Myxococcota bacterium]